MHSHPFSHESKNHSPIDLKQIALSYTQTSMQTAFVQNFCHNLHNLLFLVLCVNVLVPLTFFFMADLSLTIAIKLVELTFICNQV